MLYLLLIIIAVGVLLISPEGQKLLGLFAGLAIIAGVLYLVFWILVGGVALTSYIPSFISSNLETIQGIIIILSGYFLIRWFSRIRKKLGTKEQREEARKVLKDDIRTLWKTSKIAFTVSLIMLMLIAYLLWNAIIYITSDTVLPITIAWVSIGLVLFLLYLLSVLVKTSFWQKHGKKVKIISFVSFIIAFIGLLVYINNFLYQ